MNQEHSVLKCLPNDGQKCFAFGYKTFCCKEDMDEIPMWHEVTFQFVFSTYKIKKELPEDIEDSILEFCNYLEKWYVNDNEEPRNHLIGVTKWKSINE